jgi:hypothetical protein
VPPSPWRRSRWRFGLSLAGEPARSVASVVELAGGGALIAVVPLLGRWVDVVRAVVAVVHHHSFGAAILRPRLGGELGVGGVGVLG